MKTSGFQLLAGLFLAAVLAWPAAAEVTPSRAQAMPGSLNYIEGQASIGSQPLAAKSVGSATLQAGQTLTTEQGKVEVLLTPGVFLRLGDHSVVKMVSPSLTNTAVKLEQGQAIVEVDEIHKQNDIRIAADGATARLLKTGLYDVNARDAQLRVFDGKAAVTENDQQATVKGGHAISLNATGKLKSQKFDKKQAEQSDLYKWSSLRSAYLAEANSNAATIYAVNGVGPWGPGWWGAGWYWNPWYDAYTFIPADGVFYSPFGWGFYPPALVYESPFYSGYVLPDLDDVHGGAVAVQHHHFTPDPNRWGSGAHYPAQNAGLHRGAVPASGFHTGGSHALLRAPGGFGRMGAVRGGGFHGGAFHGWRR